MFLILIREYVVYFRVKGGNWSFIYIFFFGVNNKCKCIILKNNIIVFDRFVKLGWFVNNDKMVK